MKTSVPCAVAVSIDIPHAITIRMQLSGAAILFPESGMTSCTRPTSLMEQLRCDDLSPHRVRCTVYMSMHARAGSDTGVNIRSPEGSDINIKVGAGEGMPYNYSSSSHS